MGERVAGRPYEGFERPMALFIDTFVNRIDKKGRVSVPATFRAALNGQGFHGIVGLPPRVTQISRTMTPLAMSVAPR